MEIWRDIKGYEGLYQVSNEGRVRSCDRDVERTSSSGKKYVAHIKSKIKKPNGHQKGYEPFSLWKDNTHKEFLIHRLVAETFIPNPNGYDVVHHIDENTHNNNVENLMWMDGKEHNNMHHNKGVGQYTVDDKLVAMYSSIAEAARQTSFDSACISRCCNPKCIHYKTYKNFKWAKL